MYSENHVIVCEKKPHIFLLHIYKSEFSCFLIYSEIVNTELIKRNFYI